jgi:hypothetical protein
MLGPIKKRSVTRIRIGLKNSTAISELHCNSRGTTGNATDLNSGGVRLENRPGYLLSRLSVYVVFPISP